MLVQATGWRRPDASIHQNDEIARNTGRAVLTFKLLLTFTLIAVEYRDGDASSNVD